MPPLPRLVLAGALAALLCACGTATGDAGSTGATSEPTAVERASQEYGGEVVTVRTAGRDRLELTLVTDYDDGRCATAPRARLDREPGRADLWVRASFVSVPEGSPDCLPKPSAAFTVRAPGLERFERVVTDPREAWERGPGDTWVRCSPVVGCDPPADRCAPVWVNTLTQGADLPPERQVDVLACEAPWLVADIDALVTGCHSVDGSTPPAGCAGSGVHRRWFARWDGEAWDVVASGTAAGCADVAALPDFPRRLCADLPAR